MQTIIYALWHRITLTNFNDKLHLTFIRIINHRLGHLSMFFDFETFAIVLDYKFTKRNCICIDGDKLYCD